MRGSDNLVTYTLASPDIFQSTLPTRGSDRVASVYGTIDIQISIHAPHEGERQDLSRARAKARLISIHAPHAGERRWIFG